MSWKLFIVCLSVVFQLSEATTCSDETVDLCNLNNDQINEFVCYANEKKPGSNIGDKIKEFFQHLKDYAKQVETKFEIAKKLAMDVIVNIFHGGDYASALNIHPDHQELNNAIENIKPKLALN